VPAQHHTAAQSRRNHNGQVRVKITGATSTRSTTGLLARAVTPELIQGGEVGSARLGRLAVLPVGDGLHERRVRCAVGLRCGDRLEF
jgi:hypothetical protein